MADLVQKSLLDQMHIDDLEIQRRKELLGLAPFDEQLLARSRPIILQRLKQIVDDRLRIGLVHKRIGVEPKLYLSAIRSLQQILRRVLSEDILDEEVRASTLDALEKIFF